MSASSSSASRAPRQKRRAPKRVASIHGSKVFPIAGSEIPFMSTRPQIVNEIYTRVSMFEIRTALTTSTTVETGYGLAVTAQAHINDFANLTTVFDQYRLASVEVWMLPREQTNGLQDNGLLTSVIDYDDAAVVTSTATLNDYENSLISRGDCGHYRSFVPHAAAALYSGVFTSFGNLTAPWVDAASGTVAHYGFKAASSVTGTAFSYDIVLRIVSQWKNGR